MWNEAMVNRLKVSDGYFQNVETLPAELVGIYRSAAMSMSARCGSSQAVR